MAKAPYERFGTAVRDRRLVLGFTQEVLAKHLGMSRQNLTQIETGKRLPGMLTARGLAAALQWSMDELGHLLPLGESAAPIRWAFEGPPTQPVSVVWTQMDQQLVAAPAGRLAVEFAQDGVWDPDSGVIHDGAATRHPEMTLFVAGCDPLLLWMWQRTPHPDIELYVFSMGSQAAVRALEAGHVHIAGTHLFDPGLGRYNTNIEHLPFPVRRLKYLYWEAGVMGALQSPDGWALRELGSEARALYERHFGGASQPEPVVELDSHWAVARYVSSHPHLAGIGIRPVAQAMNLPFARWLDEPFEWVTRQAWAGDARVRAFEAWLGSPAVTQMLAEAPGINPWDPGQAVD